MKKITTLLVFAGVSCLIMSGQLWAADCQNLSGEALEKCQAAAGQVAPAAKLAPVAGETAAEQIQVTCRSLKGKDLAQCRGKILYRQTAAANPQDRYRSRTLTTRKIIKVGGEHLADQDAEKIERVYLVGADGRKIEISEVE